MKTLSQLFLIVSFWAICLNGHAGEVTDVITKDKLQVQELNGYHFVCIICRKYTWQKELYPNEEY